MKKHKLTPIGLTLSLCVLLSGGVHDSHAQDVTLEAIALVGDAVSGGELTIRALSEAAIDSSGRVVFRDPDFRVATIFQSTGPGAGFNRVSAEAAGFTIDVDDPVLITFNATELNSTPIVNAAGTLAFTSAIFNESRSVSINSVLFRGSSVTDVDDLVRSDMLDLPGLDEVEVPGSVVAGIVGFAMNASGTVAFVTQPFGLESGGTTRMTGVFVASGGAPTRIALDGEQAPGTPGGAVFGGFGADSLVINANGDVAFLGLLEQGTGGVTSENSAGIWVSRNGALQLVARQGDDVPGSAAGDLFAGFFGMSISPTGEVAFQGRTEASVSAAGIWRGTSPADLRAVSVDGRTSRGELQPTSLGVSVGLGSFSVPVFTKAGDLLFIANGGPVESAIWMDDDGTLRPVLRGAVFEDGNISIIMPGDEATGTGGNFSTFENFVANGEGRVAFTASYIGPLQSSSSSVWAQDSAGVPRLVGQQGDTVQTADGPKTIQRITFLSGRGNASGYGSGFSDTFQLAVSIDFQEGGSGIFRATVDTVSPPPPPPPPLTGNDYFWNRSCGDDNWHTICGDKTSWLDEDDVAHMSPPGASGNENVTIATNSSAGVTLDREDAQIGKLSATGKLIVRKSLTLNQQSTVESLILDSLESEIVANAKLTLTGSDSVFQAGTITINSDDGVVNEGTVTVEAFSLALPTGLAISKTNVNGAAKSSQPRAQVTTTIDFGGSGPWINANGSTFVQKRAVIVDGRNGKTAIRNAKGATWIMEEEDLLFGTVGEAPKFVNEGELRKKSSDPDDESFIDLAFEQKTGGSISVESGNLTFRGGGSFVGSVFNETIRISDTSTLHLTSPVNVNRADYRVLSGITTILSRDNGFGMLVIDDGAVLSILPGAGLVTNLRSAVNSDRDGVLLDAGGELIISGIFRNEGSFTWKGGKITVPTVTSGTPEFLNVGFLEIEGETTKTLAGRLLNKAAQLGEGFPAEIRLRAKLTLASGAEIENAALSPTSAGGSFTISDDGEIAVLGSDAVFRNKGDLVVQRSNGATADTTATIAARFDNTGVVAVFPSQTLRLTGVIAQLEGTALIGGTWSVIEGVLDLNGRSITTLGNTSGPPTAVDLFGAAEVRDFELERIEKTGSLFVWGEGQSLILAKGLTSNGNLTIQSSGARMTVNGDFDQFGKLLVGKGGVLQVNNGALVLRLGSKTTINGTVTIDTNELSGLRTVFEARAELGGVGTINAETIKHILGRWRPGQSPGFLTINGDYEQSTQAILEIEIGGTEVGTNQDQLVINGNADMNGTLVLKFVDDFSPTTGQTFDFLSVSGTQSGDFQSVEIVDLAPGFEFEVSATGTGFMMTAMNDGVFTGIVGEINDVTIGFNSPKAETTAARGDTNVPMLQFEVVPESDGLTITSLTLSAGGSGDDAIDLSGITVWADEDGDGRVGSDDIPVGSGTYDVDNGTLDLAIDPPLEVAARETITLLVTYDIAGAEADTAAKTASGARASNDMPSRPVSRFSVGLAVLTLPLIFGLGLVAVRKPKIAGWLCLGMATTVWIAGCGTGGTAPDPAPDPVPTAVTYRVTLTAIGADEKGTGADASVDNLSLAGTNLTVSQ